MTYPYNDGQLPDSSNNPFIANNGQGATGAAANPHTNNYGYSEPNGWHQQSDINYGAQQQPQYVDPNQNYPQYNNFNQSQEQYPNTYQNQVQYGGPAYTDHQYGEPGYAQQYPQQQAYAQPVYGQPMQQTSHIVAPQSKDKIIAIVLWVIASPFGVHNFYIGYSKIGLMQLVLGLIGLVLFGTPVIGLLVWLGILVWCVIDLVQMIGGTGRYSYVFKF